MILHVYEAAKKSNTGEVYVATPDKKIIDVRVKAASTIYDPAYKCSEIISFAKFAAFGPIKAEPIPASNIIDIAFGAISFFTVSTAAKRY